MLQAPTKAFTKVNSNIHEADAFVNILKACARNKDLYRGTRLHDDILRKGLLEQCSNALVTMYAKCGALGRAKELFDTHKSTDVVTWTAVISGYAQKGRGHDALLCFEKMKGAGLSPDAVTFTCVLKACGAMGAAKKGEQIHDDILKQGLLHDDIVLNTALVDMYAKCGALTKAQKLVKELPVRGVVTWNALIGGYVQQGQAEKALTCFKEMQDDGLSPDDVTFISILKACGSIGAANKGGEIHEEIARQGLLRSNILLGTALVDMYAKCGLLGKAQQVLEELPVRDVVSWSALIAGYVEQGLAEQALYCYERMEWEGLVPNAVTFASITKACASLRAADTGEKIHNDISQMGFLRSNIVLGTALIDMYVKCGLLAKAQKVLEELSVRDVVSWSALIAGYVQQGQNEQALNCLEQMQSDGLSPNAVTFTCILNACGGTGAIDMGEKMHDEVVRRGLLGSSLMLGNALVDMYAKSGALEKAERVLKELIVRDVVSWNTLIGGYAQQGRGEALNCFEWMKHEGLSPDAITFASVLSICSLLGRVEDAVVHFTNMCTKYAIKPDLEHYSCLVDLLGRAGHLNKAIEVRQRLPFSTNSSVCCVLLCACQKWGDVKVGKWAFEQAIQLDEGDAQAYTLMADIYASAGMHEDAENIIAMRKKNNAIKS